MDYLTISGFEADGVREEIGDAVTAAGERPWFCCDEDIQAEGLIDVQMPKPIAHNRGKAGIP